MQEKAKRNSYFLLKSLAISNKMRIFAPQGTNSLCNKRYENSSVR